MSETKVKIEARVPAPAFSAPLPCVTPSIPALSATTVGPHRGIACLAGTGCDAQFMELTAEKQIEIAVWTLATNLKLPAVIQL